MTFTCLWGDTLPLFSFPDLCSHNWGCEQQISLWVKNTVYEEQWQTWIHKLKCQELQHASQLQEVLTEGIVYQSFPVFHSFTSLQKQHKWGTPEAERMDSLDTAASWFYLSVRSGKKRREWWVEGNVTPVEMSQRKNTKHRDVVYVKWNISNNRSVVL